MAAVRTLNTLRKSAHTVIVGKACSTFSVTSSSASCLLNKLNHNANKQQSAGYRAAVLHEIAKPLVIEDVAPVTKLKGLEVCY